MKKTWTISGFDAFMRGTVGNGGQNMYVSRAGVLQRIYNFDTKNTGYPDLPFANSQSMGERPDVSFYRDPTTMQDRYHLPSNGSFDGVVADLSLRGKEDVVICCQSNGTHADNPAVIFYGTEDGYTENVRVELPCPDAIGVCAGRFSGNERPSLCFLSGGKPRVFDQDERGFNAMFFTELDVQAAAVCAADIDGDGFDDLYFHRADGKYEIRFGSKEGFTRTTVFGEDGHAVGFGGGSTAGRRLPFMGARPCVVTYQNKTLLFRGTESGAEFYEYKDGNVTLLFILPVPHAVYAVSGDLNGDGQNELIVLAMSDKNATELSALFDKDGNKVCDIRTKAALTATVCDVDGDGKDEVYIAQTSDGIMRTTESQYIAFNADLTVRSKVTFPTGETARILCAKPDGKHVHTVVVEHETGRVRGDEMCYLCHGSKDGYSTKNRTDLPGWSAVDMLLADMNDDGLPECIVTNCMENYPQGDRGTFIYRHDGKGVTSDNPICVDTIRNHGTAVGDFNHDGYLDMACGGIYNREIRILHGGPNGWTTDDMERVVFGPKPDEYHPYVANVFEDPNAFTPEEGALADQWGENRWMFTADFNGDGWLDLFVTLVNSGYAYILWGGPQGFSLERSTRLNCEGAICATAADLNKNGYLDLIIGGHVTHKKSEPHEAYITVYWGGPNGYTEDNKMMLPTPTANSVTVGDFSHTGWLDIYATAYNNGRERDLDSFIYHNDNGRFSIRNRSRLFVHSGCGCVAGDFLGRGYTDLAVACHKQEGDHCGDSFIFWGGENGLDEKNSTVIKTVGPHGMSTVDPGNIFDRSDREYYVTEPYHLDKSAHMTVTLDTECSSTGKVEVEVRCDGKAWVPYSEKMTVCGNVELRLALYARCGCGAVRVKKIETTFEE